MKLSASLPHIERALSSGTYQWCGYVYRDNKVFAHVDVSRGPEHVSVYANPVDTPSNGTFIHLSDDPSLVDIIVSIGFVVGQL